MKKLFSIFSVLFFSASIIFAQDAQEGQSITVEQIVDAYLESIGGQDAWKKVKSMRMTGIANTQGQAFDLTMINMEPNLTKLEIDIQGKKMVPQAYDGETAWSLNPFASAEATKIPDEDAEEMKKQPFQDEFIDYKKKGSTVELLGMKDIDGTATLEIKLVNKDKVEKFYYFETENYVPIMQKQVMNSGEMKGIEMETYMSDYQEVDGLMIPHAMEQKVGGQTAVEITINKIELNPEGVDKSAFEMPKAEAKEEKQ